MLSLFRATKFCAAILVAATMVAGTPTRSYAETGSVRLKITKVGFIVGVGGGSGTLTFRGKHYRLSIGGVSAGTIGVAGGGLFFVAPHRSTAAGIAGIALSLSLGGCVGGGAAAAKRHHSNAIDLHV